MNTLFWRYAIVGMAGWMLSGVGAASTAVDISNVPMAVETGAPPNIQYTLDNSGSMGWTYLPDAEYINSPAYALFYTGAEASCFENSAYNAMYYDPTKTYSPPVNGDGSLKPNASFTAALYDGFLPYDGNINDYLYNPRIDLSNSFQSDLYLPYAANNWYYGGYDTPQAAYYYAYKSGTPTPGTCYANVHYTLTTVNSPAQQQNFANWFSYYRARMQTMRTAIGRAFQPMPNQFRIGFSVINDGNGYPNVSGYGFIAMGAWTGTQKTSWFNNLYSMEPNGGTPTPSALVSDGEYFSGNGMIGAPSGVDPIQASCQQNFTIVSTDGYWNQTSLNGQPSAGDQDNSAPNASWFTGVSNLGFTPGSQWPNPFYEGTGITDSNTLADIAMKYWATDLRSAMTNNVSTNSADPATWQHMVTYGIGLEAGTLSFPSALTSITAGTQTWPNPTGANLGGPAAIDDLWHAAVNGHGQFFLASQGAGNITTALQTVLSNITGRIGAGVAAGVSNPNVTSGNNSVYVATYNSGDWSGDLNSFSVNTSTGVISTTPNWASSAQAQLDALTSSLTSGTSRNIGTFNGANGVGFDSSGISTAMQSQLDTPITPPGPSDWLGVLNFIRGVNTSAYRNRTHALGDIIDAQPVPVAGPPFQYADAGYAAFQSTNASRQGVVYQGANDGMLHTFNAASGAELWAYVPGILFNTPLSTTYPNTSTLVNLSLQTGFQHLYYVDGTPVYGDVDFSNTIAGGSNGPPPSTYTPDWHSLLVGGLDAGGEGYYALDITSPSATSDAAVAGKVLWEFPQASNSATYASEIGLSYGKPVLVKTVASGWVAMVTSGYNNTDGKDHLFVLNPQTGAVIKDLVTPAGHGLAQIAAYAQNTMVDNITPSVYGGDLDGNVWKFDFSGATVSTWNVSLLASLVDGNGVSQPVTTRPELAEINGVPVVFVGTGEYLGNSDVPNMSGVTPNVHATQMQTMYALSDTGTTITNVRGATMVQQSLSSPQAVNFTADRGWYLDLNAHGATSGDRIDTNPAIVNGVLTFSDNQPSGLICSPGGISWPYLLDINNGGAVGSTAAIGAQENFLTVGFTLMGLPNGSVYGVSTLGSGSLINNQVPPGNGGSSVKHRVSWQELP